MRSHLRGLAFLSVLLLASACEHAPTTAVPTAQAPVLNTAPAASCTVPAGQVIVGQTTQQQCGTSPALLVKVPGLTETVCANSPVPPGYVTISDRQNTTNTCVGNLEMVIQLPDVHAWVCSNSPVPTGYRVLPATRANGCGPTKTNRFIVRWNGVSPIGGQLRFTPPDHFEMIACQPDHPTNLTVVHLYEGAPYPWGRKVLADTSGGSVAVDDPDWGIACGDTYRPLVTSVFSAAQLQAIGSGNRVLYAHALDMDGGVNPVVGWSLIVGQSPTTGASPPMGQFVGATPDGLLYGFACQLEHPSFTTELHVYADAPYGQPGATALVATRTAYRQPWRFTSYCQTGGFRVQLTAAHFAKLTPGPHKLYIHAIDPDNGGIGPHPLIPGTHTIQVP